MPKLPTSYIDADSTKIFAVFVLELVMAKDLDVKTGGTTVLSITWGLVYTANDANLIERK
jgi:hypothetical protein